MPSRNKAISKANTQHGGVKTAEKIQVFFSPGLKYDVLQPRGTHSQKNKSVEMCTIRHAEPNVSEKRDYIKYEKAKHARQKECCDRLFPVCKTVFKSTRSSFISLYSIINR